MISEFCSVPLIYYHIYTVVPLLFCAQVGYADVESGDLLHLMCVCWCARRGGFGPVNTEERNVFE